MPENGISLTRVAVCKYCGKTPLYWRDLNFGISSSPKWVLIDGTDVSSPIHRCQKFFDSKNSESEAGQKPSSDSSGVSVSEYFLNIIDRTEELADKRKVGDACLTVRDTLDLMRDAIVQKSREEEAERQAKLDDRLNRLRQNRKDSKADPRVEAFDQQIKDMQDTWMGDDDIPF